MELKCEFCDKSFSNKSNLNYHKKNNKKCQIIQNQNSNNDISTLSSCEFCNKIFRDLNSHYKTCKKKIDTEFQKLQFEKDEEIKKLQIKKNKEIKKLQFEKDEEIKKIRNEKDEKIKRIHNEKDEEIKKLRNEKDEEIKKLQMRIVELEAENKIYLQDRDLVQKLAAQPKTTTNNNDNRIRINNNFFDNPERIKQMIDEKLTKDYISDGQKGVAQFACNNLLKDENGNMNYICSDPSRHIFRFQNSEGNIEKDINANKLTNMLIDAGITNKTASISKSLWTKEDGDIDANKFLIFSQYTNEISRMQIDNSIFRNELASLTSV